MSKVQSEQVMSKPALNNEEDKRRFNLIVYNIPESTHEDARYRIVHDIEICQDIIEGELKYNGCENNYEIKQIFRLGKVNSDKNRPILIKLNSEKAKWAILARAKQLANSEKYQNIFIAKDMSKEEMSEKV